MRKQGVLYFDDFAKWYRSEHFDIVRDLIGGHRPPSVRVASPERESPRLEELKKEVGSRAREAWFSQPK